VYGLLGELIDTVSILATLFGVCTSLGLGVLQVNSGLSIITGDWFAENRTSQIIIIWVITLMAAVSVVSGIRNGIRRLSEFTFIIGNLMLLAVFFMDDWKYCLNTLVETTFYYVQYMIDLGGRTDGFAQAIPQVPRIWVYDAVAQTAV
jgi:choline-glycine betaine transporter